MVLLTAEFLFPHIFVHFTTRNQTTSCIRFQIVCPLMSDYSEEFLQRRIVPKDTDFRLVTSSTVLSHGIHCLTILLVGEIAYLYLFIVILRMVIHYLYAIQFFDGIRNGITDDVV